MNCRASALSIVVVVGCGPSVFAPDVGDGSTDTMPMDSGGSEAGSASGSVISPDCDALCEVVLPEGCLTPPTSDPDACQRECERVLDDPSDFAHDAFAQCVATDPLCFVTTEDCMWGILYAEPFAHRVELRGVSFGELDGATVYAWLGETSDPISAATVEISAGGFVVSFDLEAPLRGERTVFGFVDVDGDGECTPNLDFGIYEGVAVSGPFEAPRFEAELSALDGSKDFICSSNG